MSLLGELNDLLKQIPVWRELITLPARVRAIEEKLKIAAAPAVDGRETCRYCRTGKLDLQNSQPHPMFGDMGMKIDTLKCDNPACGKVETRDFDPMKRA